MTISLNLERLDIQLKLYLWIRGCNPFSDYVEIWWVFNGMHCLEFSSDFTLYDVFLVVEVSSDFFYHLEYTVSQGCILSRNFFFFFWKSFHEISLDFELVFQKELIIKNHSLSRIWYRILKGCAIASVNCNFHLPNVKLSIMHVV